MNTFSINYGDREIRIDQLPSDQHGNVYYVAHMPAENVRLEYTEDDEGAGHWIDEKANHETEVSTEIGRLIELYIIEHRMNR
jgi:hypothetical protein